MNRHWRRVLALSAIIVLFAASAEPVSGSIENTVSIVQLIATPEKYQGKVVQVIGFLRLEFEGNAIYLHEDDYKHAIYKNGLMIVNNANIEAKAGKINLHYVILEGTFDGDNLGNKGLNSGTISNITFVGICPTRKP